MKNRVIGLVTATTCLCAVAFGAQNSAAVQPTRAAVIDLLESYPQTLPFQKARVMDQSHVPPLLEILAAPEREDHRRQAVFLLGLLGDVRAVRPVIDLLRQGYQGDVDFSGFAVLMTSVTALGDLARTGSNEALEFLMEHRLPSEWARENLPWRHPPMSPGDLHRLLSVHAIVALGRSGRSEALVLLQEMRESEGLEQETRDAAGAGLQLQEDIQRMGLQAALNPDCRPENVKTVGLFKYSVDVRQFLLERRSEFLSEYLAESGEPVWISEHGGKTENRPRLLKRLSEEPGGIETLRQILLDIEAGEDVKQAAPLVTIAENGNAVVAIPLENSQSIVKKHAVSGVTVDSTGRLVIYMIRREGVWFWNPFGW